MAPPRFHGASVPTPVLRNALRQYEVRSFEKDPIFVIAGAMGPPRLWSYALDAAFDGLTQGLARPHNGSLTSQLHQGVEGARSQLRERMSLLIEQRISDVSMIAVGLRDGLAHVICVGPQRAYVRRAQSWQRLSPREDRAEGLLHATPAFCAETLLVSDLLLLGSASACSESSLTALDEALRDRKTVGPQQVVEILNEHAAQRGLGAAVIAVVIEDSRPVT